MDHALWSCLAARDVWLDCNAKIQKSTSDEDAFRHILMKLLERLEALEFDQVACVARKIWLRRNKMVFEEVFTPLKTVVQIAADQLEFHLKVAQGANGGRRKISQQLVEVVA